MALGSPGRAVGWFYFQGTLADDLGRVFVTHDVCAGSSTSGVASSLASDVYHYFHWYTCDEILGSPIVFSEALGLVILPSMLLNLLLAIPVFFLMRDLARWAFPSSEEE